MATLKLLASVFLLLARLLPDVLVHIREQRREERKREAAEAASRIDSDPFGELDRQFRVRDSDVPAVQGNTAAADAGAQDDRA